MSELPSSQQLHQCLHGYADGHRLVYSSVALPEPAQAAMLVLTDVPAGVSATDFSPFLSGYPLVGTAFFALARTWPAPEMSRPGCVWTHTLLVPLPMLGHLEDLAPLATQLRNPSSMQSPERHYCMPIAQAQPVTTLRSELATVPAKGILAGLYGAPTSTIRVDGHDRIAFEREVMAIWSQQWPRMRRTFSFRTAALSSVTRSASQFILTLGIEESRARVLIASQPAEVTLGLNPNARLVDLLVKDLAEPGTLRRFLWAFGADAGAREACLPLVSAYDWLHASTSSSWSADAGLEAIITSFPEPEQARRLKHTLLECGNREAYAPDLPESASFDIIQWICAQDRADHFGLTPDRASHIVSRLWGSDRNRLVDLVRTIAAKELNDSSRAVLDGLFIGLEDASLLEIARDARGLIYSLICQRPRLAVGQAVWRMSKETRQEAVRALTRSTALSESDLPDILASAFMAEAPEASALISGASDKRLVGTVLDAMKSSAGRGDAWFEPWVHAIRSRPAEVEQWLSQAQALSPDQAVAALPAVWPSWSLLRGDIGHLQQLLRDLCQTQSDQSIDAIVWMFVAGLGDGSPAAVAVALHAFEPVYFAAMNLSLTPLSTSRLDRYLPEVDRWNNWDLCLRLSLVLAVGFVEYDWAPTGLLQAARRSETLTRILDQIVRLKPGKHWLKHFYDTLVDHPAATHDQQSVLKHW